MLLIKFHSHQAKLTILKIKKEKLTGNNIFINPDLTSEVARIDKLFRIKAREYRESGKNVRIRNGTLQVDGLWYTINEETGQLVQKGEQSRLENNQSKN